MSLSPISFTIPVDLPQELVEKKCQTDWQEEVLREQIRQKKSTSLRITIDESPQGLYKSTSGTHTSKVGDIFLTPNAKLAFSKAESVEAPDHLVGRAGFIKSLEMNKDQIDSKVLNAAKEDYKHLPPSMIREKYDLDEEISDTYKWDVETDGKAQIIGQSYVSPIQALPHSQHAKARRLVVEEGVHFKGESETFKLKETTLRNYCKLLKGVETLEGEEIDADRVSRIRDAISDILDLVKRESPASKIDNEDDLYSEERFRITRQSQNGNLEVYGIENLYKKEEEAFWRLHKLLDDTGELIGEENGAITHKIRILYHNEDSRDTRKAKNLSRLLRHIKILRKAYFLPIEIHQEIDVDSMSSSYGRHPTEEDKGLFTIFTPYIFHLFDYARQGVDIRILHAEADDYILFNLRGKYRKMRARKKRLEWLEESHFPITSELLHTYCSDLPPAPQLEFHDIRDEVDIPPVTANLLQLKRFRGGGFSRNALGLQNWQRVLPLLRKIVEDREEIWIPYKKFRELDNEDYDSSYLIDSEKSLHIGVGEGFNLPDIGEKDTILMPSTPRPNAVELLVKYSRLFHRLPEQVRWDDNNNSPAIPDDLWEKDGHIRSGLKESDTRLAALYEVRVDCRIRQCLHRLRGLRGKLGEDKLIFKGGYIGEKVKERFDGVDWSGTAAEFLARKIETLKDSGNFDPDNWGNEILVRIEPHLQDYRYDKKAGSITKIDKRGKTELEKEDEILRVLKENGGKIQKTELYQHPDTSGTNQEIQEICQSNGSIQETREGRTGYWVLDS